MQAKGRTAEAEEPSVFQGLPKAAAVATGGPAAESAGTRQGLPSSFKNGRRRL